MRVPPGSAPTFRYIGAELEEFNGWSTLGDIGEFDEDGYLYLHDRRSDMITVGGVNVYPAEVEAALLEHPHVLSAAVIGLPVTSTGHRVHAIIQPSHHSLSVAEIENFLYPRLSRYKRPSTFELVQESLRDEAGKVRRSALRATRLADTHQEEFDYA